MADLDNRMLRSSRRCVRASRYPVPGSVPDLSGALAGGLGGIPYRGRRDSLAARAGRDFSDHPPVRRRKKSRLTDWRMSSDSSETALAQMSLLSIAEPS